MFNKKTALAAVLEIQHIIDDLCSATDPSYHQFCAALKTLLFDIIPLFETLPGAEFPTENASSILDELEKLCQPRHQTGVRLQTGVYDTALVEPTPRYPALALLLTSKEGARQAIKDFACHGSHLDHKKALMCLKLSLPSYSESESDIAFLSPSNATVQAESEDPPECGREISTLHKTLSTYCFCIVEEPHRSVAACIRLSSGNVDDSKVTFGLLFMDHPHHNCAETKPWWQDTEISLYRDVQTRISKVGVRSGLSKEVGLNPSIGKLKPFCHYITRQKKKGQMLLEFSVDKDRDCKIPRTKVTVAKTSTAERKLFVDHWKESVPRQWVVERPSVSLRHLLETASPEDLTEKKKEVLSVFLAKAVWQYYSSPWMPEPWDKDNVHFIFERRENQDGDSTGIFVDEPLLSVSIPVPDGSTEATIPSKETPKEDDDDDDDDDFFNQATHKIPKILGLGVMLIEIQLGRPIESLYKDHRYSRYCPNGEVYPYTNHIICKHLISMKENIYAEMETSDPLKELITNCILPNEVFMPPHVKSLGDDDIRQALYPLVNRLEIWNSKRQPHNFRPLTLLDATPMDQQTPARTPTPPQCLTNPHEEMRQGRTMAQITNSKTTEEWFSRMRCLIHILKPPIGEKYEKVKVAVLDTGVYPDSPEADYIKGYKDYVNVGSSANCDNTGHGTTSIRLVLDMCDSAHVYALRIFDNDFATLHTQQLAIKALDWCINNDIDIVCMACGFSSNDNDLQYKIREASSKMLIVAAPTNSGNRHDILYPARHEAFVLPMFATDGNVKRSALNPSQGPGKYNFAILGEDIKDINGVVKSGTSYATAIAAGFLARLLDFTRHSETAGRNLRGNAKDMKDKNKVVAVLRSMAMRTKDGPFCCIRPWDLLPSQLQQRVPFPPSSPPSRQETDSARTHVSSKIWLAIDGGLA